MPKIKPITLLFRKWGLRNGSWTYWNPHGIFLILNKAIECVKLLSNFGSPLVQSLIAYDSKDAVFRKCKIRGRQEYSIY